MKAHWLDRVTASVAPAWTLKRQRARMAITLLERHYEAASPGRRTQGWRKSSGDANAVIGAALKPLREVARELVRNNPYAESALGTIADHAVGGGIIGRPAKKNAEAAAAWKEWAESTTCDADGRHDFYGLQHLVMRTVAESGEVLVRRRLRFASDGLPLNLQLQVLDPDFLDTSREEYQTASGGKIIQGVEFDSLGRRKAYWLFPEHPGSSLGSYRSSQPVPAESVIHIVKTLRAGQVRGVTWFAPVLLRMKDFDEYEDATLMKQKIAACLAVLTTDINGTSTALGTADDTKTPAEDLLSPGAILNVPSGRDVKVVSPPQVSDYDSYSKAQLRAIATGIGVTYEDLTGDYGRLPFSAARMSRLRHWARVYGWRWRLLIPQFCTPVWGWAMQNAAIMGKVGGDLSALPSAQWTTEPPPMIDPVNEGLAYQRRIRNGLCSLPEALRELGYDPEVVLEEMKDGNRLLDTLGLILDSDPRKMTQAGQLQGEAAGDKSTSNSIEPDTKRMLDMLVRLDQANPGFLERVMLSETEAA